MLYEYLVHRGRNYSATCERERDRFFPYFSSRYTPSEKFASIVRVYFVHRQIHETHANCWVHYFTDCYIAPSRVYAASYPTFALFQQSYVHLREVCIASHLHALAGREYLLAEACNEHKSRISNDSSTTFPHIFTLLPIKLRCSSLPVGSIKLFYRSN